MEQQKGDECGDITPVRGKTQREETQHVIKQQKETRWKNRIKTAVMMNSSHTV